MNDFLYRVVSGIATEEGFFEVDTLPRRDNNPGDLRAAPWLVHPAVVHGFWVAPTLAEGIAGLYHNVALDVARGWNMTQLISAWAPPTDGNRTAKYIADMRRMVGCDPLTPLWAYLTIDRL